MPKGVIDFHYDSGQQYVKKRKRLPGANPDKRPEVKQFNPFDGTGSFDNITFLPLARQNSALTTSFLPWRFNPLVWPSQGVSMYSRVGNSFFLKSIRFKGYVEIYRNVLRPIRWRIKLFRLEKPIPDFKLTGNYTQTTNIYLDLFKNVERFAQGINTDAVIDYSRHNYYKMIKNLPKDRPYTSKVIASGVIPVNNKLISEGTLEFGQTNSFHQTSQVSIGPDIGCYPVDVLVKCNDRITYTLNEDETGYENDVKYCLVLEDDFGVGVQVSQAVYVPGESPQTAIPQIVYVSTSDPCYRIKLFSRAYFTDE